MQKKTITDFCSRCLETVGEISRSFHAYYGQKGGHLGKFHKTGNFTSLVYCNGTVSTVKRNQGKELEFIGFYRTFGGDSITKKNLIPIHDPGVVWYLLSLGIRFVGESIFDNTTVNKRKLDDKIQKNFKKPTNLSFEVFAGYSEEKNSNTCEEEKLYKLENLNEIIDVA